MRIDSCIHVNWESQAELLAHVPGPWLDYMAMSVNSPKGPRHPQMELLPNVHYPNPLGDYLPDEYADGAVPGGTLDAVQRHMERNAIGRGLVCFDRALNLPSVLNSRLSVELCRAANTWLLEKFLRADERLFGAILVPSQVPQAAAEMIQEFSATGRFAAVLLGSNGLGKPFGHQAYLPILQATAASGLPVVLHAGGDDTVDILSQPTAGGLPSTYAEHHTHSDQSLITHITSLIAHGIFDQHPDLKVLAVGGGVGWVVPYMWRFDTSYKGGRREAPWMSRLPSDYVISNVRVGTYALEQAPDAHLAKLLGAEERDISGVFLYASGFPRWDTDDVATVRRSLPDKWHDQVFSRSACELFGWADEIVNA